MKNGHLSRDTYSKIKKMNRSQMEVYLKQFYAVAYGSGVESVSKIITDKIIKGLENTKGIGEKRMAAILESIGKEINR